MIPSETGMPTTNLRRSQTYECCVAQRGHDVALEQIGVKLIRTERQVVALVEPLFGVHAKRHPAGARIDPHTAAKIGFDRCEASECVGFEFVRPRRVHATFDAIDDLPTSG